MYDACKNVARVTFFQWACVATITCCLLFVLTYWPAGSLDLLLNSLLGRSGLFFPSLPFSKEFLGKVFSIKSHRNKLVNHFWFLPTLNPLRLCVQWTLEKVFDTGQTKWPDLIILLLTTTACPKFVGWRIYGPTPKLCPYWSFPTIFPEIYTYNIYVGSDFY